MKKVSEKRIVILCVTFFLFYGCVGFVEKAGRFFDGTGSEWDTAALYSAFLQYGAPADIDIEIAENKEKEKSLIIFVKSFPMVKIMGTVPDEDGIFYFTSLEYIGGSAHGWNEFSMELSGSGRIVLKEIGTLEVAEMPEKVQITKGRIHRYDTRITGDDAVSALRSRRERIVSLTEWMLSKKDVREMDIKNFEKYWKPILFPEIALKKNRPSDWRQEGDVFMKADDINWNITYTEQVFSEELWPVRNSGTMLRDWEEALPYIFFEYEWENFLNIFSNKIIFYKVK